MIINVASKTGKYAFSDVIGESIYQEINQLLLNTSEPIQVDFQDVQVVVCKFWSYAIGQLLRNWDSDTLNQRVDIINISSYQSETLQSVLDNAKKFYHAQNHVQPPIQ